MTFPLSAQLTLSATMFVSSMNSPLVPSVSVTYRVALGTDAPVQELVSDTLIGTTFPYLTMFRSLSWVGDSELAASAYGDTASEPMFDPAAPSLSVTSMVALRIG